MSSNWLYIVYLLLPVAFISGWWSAKRHYISSYKDKKRKLHPDYFKGLNYVLNEEPDKAIEIFVKMIEVDSETVETHLALGNLFRRRGEVDRAIRIHQNLIARPSLSKEFRAQALLELGMDYLRLGILDRAEGLFSELIESDILTAQAFTYLLDIYQQEQDWDKAITTAKRLESITGEKHEQLIAQFYCELAQRDLSSDNVKSAKSNLKRALNLDGKCVRASLMEADVLMNSQNYRSAISALKRIEKQDSDYTDEALLPLQKCFNELQHEDKYIEYLNDLLNRHGGTKPLIMLTEIIARNKSQSEALSLISDKLSSHPTVIGVDHLINYIIPKSDGEIKKHLSTIKELTTRLLDKRSVYKCNICGYEAIHIHWHCPSCKKWNTVKPVQGV